MTPLELHSTLSARFPNAISEWQEPKAGDPFVSVRPDALLDICSWLKNESSCSFDFLRLITGVDRGDQLGVVYHLHSYAHNHNLTLHADVPKDAPKIASVALLWPTADWMERETFDMLGIEFEGHPYLKRILLPLDWEGFPLRKDYKQPEEYHGIKHG